MSDRQRPLRPRGGAPGGRRKRRVVIDTQAARPRPDARQQRDVPKQERAPQQVPAPQTGPIKVNSGATVKELSAALGVSVPEIIKIMMNAGEMVTITQTLSDEAIEVIAAESKKEVEIKHADEEELEPEVYEDDPDDLSARPPVVTIMGHVDHGKTTLLDAIRQSAVVETEAGGITQHIGAYQVDHAGRRITFLDTPGHEAFTALRARGAKVTDIAVLVVAADDGVMPQTVESINHARAAEVPVLVAVNKIDRPEANPQKVRQELVTHSLQPEDWGGTTQFADVSAKSGEGIDELLEKILLVADAELELQANAKAEASGPIIESRLDIGRGPVATMLVSRGTIRVGDAIVAGDAWGKVRALLDFRGEKVEGGWAGDAGRDPRLRQASGRGRARPRRRERAPGSPARPAPRPARPAPSSLRGARRRAFRWRSSSRRWRRARSASSTSSSRPTSRARSRPSSASLRRSTTPRSASTSSTPGSARSPRATSMLASASNAVVIGFNVRPNAEARSLAEREGVDLRTYRVIYQLTDDIRQALVGMLTPETHENVLGEAEVRTLFRASRLGVIAGSLRHQRHHPAERLRSGSSGRAR